MPTRFAATLSLISFTACLVAGLVHDIAFGTLVWRAMVAMGGTFAVGLAIGHMARVMLAEDRRRQEKLLEERRLETIEEYRKRSPVLEVSGEGVR